MANVARKIGYFLQTLGLDPRRTVAAMQSVAPYLRGYLSIRRQRDAAWPIELFPALGDRAMPAGAARGHYFHMDLWAARAVFKGNFNRVVDVGSRIDGYVAHVLAFRSIECLDVRPMTETVPGLHFRQADMMESTSLPSDYADCVSCLHAIEHFGLGRYGDPVDVDGWRKGLAGLARLMTKNGVLLLAVPVGRQRIEFDAHRVFDPDTIIDTARELGLSCEEFSLIDDKGDFFPAVDPARAKTLDYGCGCFRLVRG